MPLFPLRAAPLAETEKNSVISFFTIFHKRFHRFQQLKHDCAVMFIICSYHVVEQISDSSSPSTGQPPGKYLYPYCSCSLPERALPQTLLPLLFYMPYYPFIYSSNLFSSAQRIISSTGLCGRFLLYGTDKEPLPARLYLPTIF